MKSPPLRQFEWKRSHALPFFSEHPSGRRRRLLERRERRECPEQKTRVTISIRQFSQQFHHVLHSRMRAGDERNEKSLPRESEVRLVSSLFADFKIPKQLTMDVGAER